MYVWVFACISECHEYVSLCTTILLCLLSRLLSFARSLFPSSLLLSLLPFSLSLSHSILFLSTFLSVNLFHFLPLAISHVLTFHALLLSLSLSFTLSFSFHLTDSKNLFQEKFSFSILVRCPRCSRSFRNEKRLVGHAWKNTWKDWWKNYRGAPVEWWWKRRDDNQTRIALKFKRFSRSSIDILARSISPFFSFFLFLPFSSHFIGSFFFHHSYGPFSPSSFSVSHSLGLTRSPIVSLVVNRLRKCLTVRRRGRENVKRKDIPCYFTYRIVRFLCI